MLVRVRSDTTTNITTLSDTGNNPTIPSSYSNAHYILGEIIVYSGQNVNLTFYPQVEKGTTVTAFEQYTGGQASPNPDYQQEIKVVTGNQDVVVSGINKLSSANTGTQTNNDFSVTCNGEGTYTINSIPSGTYRDVVFTLKSNYTIKNGDYLQINNDFADYRANIILKDTSNTAITSTITYNVTNRIWDLSSYEGQTIKYISIGFSNTAENKGTLKPLICNSSTQVPFEPYITPTSYQLSLGDIELNAIGNYKDYIYKSEGNWYVHKDIYKTILDGTEYWSLSNSAFYLANTAYSQKGIPLYTNSLGTICMSDRYKAMNNTNSSANVQNFKCCFYVDNSTVRLYLGDNRFNTTNAFKTWLSSNNVTMIYAMATPTNTQITDTTLINQLEEIYNAHSLNGTTIITSNGNLPMIIKVRGLKGE